MTHDEMGLLLHCAYCGAGPSQHCVAKSGRRARDTHNARYEIVSAIWSEGFAQGEANMANWYRLAKDPDNRWSNMERFERQVDSALKHKEE